MGLRDLFSRSKESPDGVGAEGGVAPADAGAAEMPTIIQGAPVPGESGPDDQTFIAPAQDFGEPSTDARPEPFADSAGSGGAEPADGHAPPQAQPPVPQGQPERPGFRERGRLRRRLRYLREVRELGYRDLGGLVLDQHRFQRPNEELVEGKVDAIEAIDAEMRAIEHALQTSAPYTELFIPGLSACPRCGALHESDANFCPQCGLSFKGPRTVAGVGAPDGGAVVAGGAYPPPPGAVPMDPAGPVQQAPAAYPPAPAPAPVQPQPPQDTQVQPAPPPAPQDS